MSDLIERQRILKKVSDIDEINKHIVVNYYDPKVLIVNSVVKQMQKIMIGMIENAPAIEPERKKGKWIEQDDAWDGVYYECSVCKEPFTLIDGTPLENLYNFCPNCGADMREDQDGKSD